MIVRPTSRALFACLLLATAACGGGEGSVVVGLTTDMAVAFEFDELETTLKVDGAVAYTERLSYGAGELRLPAELSPLPANDAAELDLSVAAFRDGAATPVVTRRARSRAEGGRTLFLPVSLDEACAGMVCPNNTTCIAGACADPFDDPSSLVDYDPTWIESAKDACKTPPSAEPSLDLGKGESAFASLENDEVVPIEPGPQGGNHVWLALRVRGLRQMGSTLTVKGRYPELAYDVLPFSAQVTLRKEAQGQCEIHGVRFQVDRGLSVDDVRGKALDIEVTLRDPDGDVATVEKQVIIAP